MHSIVYGQSMLGNSLSIVLFTTMLGFLKAQNTSFHVHTPIDIIGHVIKDGAFSVLLGLLGGFFSCMVFKYIRFLCISEVVETCILLIIAIMTYLTSQSYELSPLISLLVCSIIMAHYTWYNLSPQGRNVSSLTVSIFGTAGECMIYAYIGLCTSTFNQTDSKGNYKY